MLKELFTDYEQWKENYNLRYFPSEQVENIIFQRNYSHEVIGFSFQNRKIYKLSEGTGKFKILFWCQMHGNETTATKALFDIWNLLNSENEIVKELLNNVSIDFIPQLNPDGANIYSRRNAAGIDLNRDFLKEQSPEIKVLKQLVDKEKYDFLFNMHDQRTIFHPKNSNKPATLSFLAPSTDNTKNFPENHKKAVQLISCMISELTTFIPDQIARFSDEFYPKATGDNFQKAGYTTILMECGHYPLDYQRNNTRKFTALAILSALNAVLNADYQTVSDNFYYQTPVNDQKFFDILYKGIKLKNESSTIITDMGIQFEEILELGAKEIIFKAKIAEIGDLLDNFGHEFYDAEERIFKNETGTLPKIGDAADFNLEDWKIRNGKKV